MSELTIVDLHVSVEGKPILKGLDLRVRGGEVHAIMGPNGTGKTTLALALMGHPRYRIERGDVLFDGRSLLGMSPDQRAKLGLFMAFQYPSEVPGVTVVNFLRAALSAARDEEISAWDFLPLLEEKMKLLGMPEDFAQRYLNAGFSGGEKKRCEMLQMALLQPKVAVLDETDSGLDIDALKAVAGAVNTLRGPDLGLLLITHYHRLLQYIVPDHVHVMMNGRIVHSGGKELALELEAKGYDFIKAELAGGVA